MSTPMVPSPDQPGTPTPSQATGNEPSSQSGSTAESRPKDFSALNQQQLLQETVRMAEELAARNRDYGASKQEAIRLAQELENHRKQVEQYQAALTIYGNQARTQQQTPETQAQPAQTQPAPSYSWITDGEVKEFSDAVISDKPGAAKNILGSMFNKFEQTWTQKWEQKTQQEREQQAAIASLNQAVDPNLWKEKDFQQKVLEKYAQLSSDPYVSITTKNVPINIGGHTLNANILREAAREARAELGGRKTVTTPEVVGSGSQTTQPMPGDVSTTIGWDPTNVEHVKKLMTEEELDYVNRKKYTNDQIINYFKWLPEKVKEARLKYGKPIVARELGIREIFV